jgi:TetR/AcrR family tetracycline transcriptional repressor
LVRRSPGRPPVPLDRIIATALQIVDEDGIEALSMRSLAQRLDSGTATLYRHFSGRADLVGQVVDRIFGEVEFDVERLAAMDWQQALRTVVHAMFQTLGRHRNAARLLVEQIPVGPNALAQREAGIAFLLNVGFPPELAARSYATLARFVLGFAIQFAGAGDQRGRGESDEVTTAVLRGLDPTEFPATASVADWLPVPLEDEFAFGLELIIDALGRTLEDHLRRLRDTP